ARFVKERFYELEYILSDDLVSFSVRVNAIRLHQFLMLVNVDQQKGDEAEIVFFRQTRVHDTKCFDVIGAVVWRQRDAKQNQRDVCLLQLLNDLLEITADRFNGNAPKSVISSKFDNDELWVQIDDVIHTC